MFRRNSEMIARMVLNFLLVAAVVFSIGMPRAHAADGLVNRAFVALEAQRYEQALDLLDRAMPAARSNLERAKITYYRGFALEKLGRCDAAELAYRRVLDAQGKAKIGGFAREALDGFDTRCVPAAATPEVREVELPRGSGRVGWKVFGWTTMIVGGLALGAIPIKKSLERKVTSQAEPYFSLQYNCDVEDGAVSGARCDREGLEKDQAFIEYESSLETAQTWTDVMLYGGIGLAAVGATTVLLVAVTRPDADDVVVSFVPTPDGVVAGALIRF